MAAIPRCQRWARRLRATLRAFSAARRAARTPRPLRRGGRPLETFAGPIRGTSPPALMACGALNALMPNMTASAAPMMFRFIFGTTRSKSAAAKPLYNCC